MSGYHSSLLPARRSPSAKRKRSSFSPESRTPKSLRKQHSKTSQLKDTSIIKEKDKSYVSNARPSPHTKGKKSKKSLVQKDLDKLDRLINPPSDNTILREEVQNLKKTVKKQNKTLNGLCDKILKERQEVKEMTEKFIDVKKKDSLILELKDRLEYTQNQEMSLLGELREQQKKMKGLDAKVSELEEKSKQDVEEARKYYKEHYSKKYKEKIDVYEKEKEQVMANLKELERIHGIETMSKSAAENEANSYKVQLEAKTGENEVLKEEVRRLEEQIKDMEEGKGDEVEELRVLVEDLRRENEELKVREDESNREFQEIWQADAKRRAREDEMNMKVQELHRKMEDMEKEVVKRDDQFASMETYYKDRIETTARVQEQRRKEWSDIYNELLGEVRELKEAMTLLEMENQRLQSTTRKSHMFDDVL